MLGIGQHAPLAQMMIVAIKILLVQVWEAMGTVDEISDYHERTECIVWVALMDATTNELDKMKEERRHSARRVCTEGGILPDS